LNVKKAVGIIAIERFLVRHILSRKLKRTIWAMFAAAPSAMKNRIVSESTDNAEPTFRAAPKPSPIANATDATTFALIILYGVAREKRRPAARTAIDGGRATRRSDRFPNDNGENPCPATECPMMYREARNDTANPMPILGIPPRRSREVRTPRLTNPMMYAEGSPCIPRLKRNAIGAESATVRKGPKESRVKGRPRAFFNCGNAEHAPS
jgi:hypothetical protein